MSYKSEVTTTITRNVPEYDKKTGNVQQLTTWKKYLKTASRSKFQNTMKDFPSRL